MSAASRPAWSSPNFLITAAMKLMRGRCCWPRSSACRTSVMLIARARLARDRRSRARRAVCAEIGRGVSGRLRATWGCVYPISARKTNRGRARARPRFVFRAEMGYTHPHVARNRPETPLPISAHTARLARERRSRARRARAMSITDVLHALDRGQQQRPRISFIAAVIKKFGDDQAGRLAALIAY